MANINSALSILSLPDELIISIFGSLPSFCDVVYFATTCRLYHEIWIKNASIIYKAIAPRTILCHGFARQLLSDQGVLPFDAARLSFKHVLQIVRNNKVIELNIAHFNAHIIRAVQTHNMVPGPQPTALTPTKRHRFARGLYQLWGLFIMDPTMRRKRIHALKLKHLLSICDLLSMYSDHLQEDARVRQHTNEDCFAVHAKCFARFKQLAKDIHNDNPSDWVLTESDGIGGHFSLWDAYQPLFKEKALFGAYPDRNRTLPPLPSPDTVWDDDTSDEDQAEGAEPGNERPVPWRCGPKGCCRFNLDVESAIES